MPARTPLLLIFLLYGFILSSCTHTVKPNGISRLKAECLSAIDERCYAEMTEYSVLKDKKKLEALLAAGKVKSLPANQQVTVIRKKIDMALVEYQDHGISRQVWVALKYLQQQ